MSVRIVKSQKGSDLYEINGYLYIKTRQKVNPETGEKTISLTCTRSRHHGCRNSTAALIVTGDSIHIKHCSPIENHNHPSQSQELLEKTIKFKMKAAVAENPTKSTKQVYNQVIIEEMSTIQSHKEELITSLPTFGSVRTILARTKKRYRPKLPTDMENFKLEGQWTTADNEHFVLFETEDKIIAFATTEFLRILCTSQSTKTIYMDGTFKTIPKPFVQLYTIHAFYKRLMFPFIYVLLPNRTEDTYIRMFELIQDAAAKLNLNFEPKTVISDCEVTAMNALRKYFPSINIKGNYFHFSQSVWRQFKQFGLLPFENDEIVKKLLVRCAALPLSKLEDLTDAWTAILAESVEESHSAYHKVASFKNYMVQTWLDGPTAISPHIWNCCNNFCIRTNNHIEGWHNELNKACNKKKATIFNLIGAIKSQHVASKAQMLLLDIGNEPQLLNSKSKQLNTTIRKATTDYDNEDITLIDFLTIVGFKLPLHT